MVGLYGVLAVANHAAGLAHLPVRVQPERRSAVSMLGLRLGSVVAGSRPADGLCVAMPDHGARGGLVNLRHALLCIACMHAMA